MGLIEEQNLAGPSVLDGIRLDSEPRKFFFPRADEYSGGMPL